MSESITIKTDRSTLYLGDSKAILPTLQASSIDSIITDPPYELGIHGKKWDSSGIAYNVTLWRECLRLLKPGGHLMSFGGSRTYHRMACAIEDVGFEIRDQIMWLYGQGFPKSHNLDGEWKGWGTALKPAHEPIVMARKPIIGTVAQNVAAFGTGALNVDACRVPGEPEPTRFDPKKHSHEGWRMTATGSEIAENASLLGRWPANVIHDGSEEVLAEFAKFGELKSGKDRNPTSQGNSSAFFGSGSKYYNHATNYGDSGTAARFFYCGKASRKDRNEGCDNLPGRNTHPTVKPTELMRYLCRLVTPPGGVVLDPFAGSGSTGKAALLEGLGFIGIEQDSEYFEIARARVSANPVTTHSEPTSAKPEHPQFALSI